MKRKLFLLLTGASMYTPILQAQSAEKPWNVGIYAGKSEYHGDLGMGFFNFSKAFYGFGAASVSRYLCPSFDLGIYGSYGEHGFYESKTSHFLSRNFYSDLCLKYKFIKKDNPVFSPYIFAGVGFRNLTKYNVKPGLDFVLPGGIGFDLRLTSGIALRYFATAGYTNHDDRDLNSTAKYNDGQLQHNIGLAFSFGKKKDEDKDGVSDKRDKCPGTPEKALVDFSGCIIDKDKDGIADNLDECPEVAGIPLFKGCPDKDNDGIKDSEDACPEVAGLVAFKGCPDSDKDGIEDKEDKCPTVAGIKELAGCPDTDGDGITDSEDKCPALKGVASLAGCPDKDGDGVSDPEDKCPNVAGIAANKGCPEVKAETKAVFEKALQGIQFESGKDIIKKSSYTILDAVVKIMQENPEYSLLINGHTDDSGDDQKNLTLSENRAVAVQNYLTNKGIQVSRLAAKGYGETQPVESNKTAKGRAKNRRVEFVVQFQ